MYILQILLCFNYQYFSSFLYLLRVRTGTHEKPWGKVRHHNNCVDNDISYATLDQDYTSSTVQQIFRTQYPAQD